MPYRALVLAEESWIAARALRAWLDAGHEAAEAWCTPRSSLARPVRQPRALTFGDWSMRRILRRRGIPVRRCPPLRMWPEAAGTTRRTAYHVTGIARVLGGPTGTDATVGWRTIDLDIVDSRLRLARRGPDDRMRELAGAAAALWRRHGRPRVATA